MLLSDRHTKISPRLGPQRSLSLSLPSSRSLVSETQTPQMALRTLATRKTLTGRLGLGFQGSRGLQTFSLPDLPYDYGALEPAISGEIMQIHHQKHHQTYVTNYNKSLEQLDAAMEKGCASTVVKLQAAIKFNGGGPLSLACSLCLFIICFDCVDFDWQFL